MGATTGLLHRASCFSRLTRHILWETLSILSELASLNSFSESTSADVIFEIVVLTSSSYWANALVSRCNSMHRRGVGPNCSNISSMLDSLAAMVPDALNREYPPGC
jgi:hypothetical protein